MLVVFTEEPSMKAALEILLPKIGVTDFRIFPHEGATDLERSLRTKLRAWRDPQARFLVLRDSDKGDCRARKKRLTDIVQECGKEDKTLVRIICRELEAWFLGDMEALRKSGILNTKGKPAIFKKDPDSVAHPSEALRNLKADYQKISGAVAIAKHMVPERNRSGSFHQTISAAIALSS